jgi:hypothetical protein
MTLFYRFLSRGRGIECKVSDCLTLTELTGIYTDILLSPRFIGPPPLYMFFDFADDTSVDISAAELHRAAEALINGSPKPSIRRVTAIFAKNDVAFKLATEWQRFIAPVAEVEVFTNRVVAVEWLRTRVAVLYEFQIEL